MGPASVAAVGLAEEDLVVGDFREEAAASAAVGRAGSGKMKIREFIDALAEEKIVEAVRTAESRTSGEIRVFVTRRKLRGEDLRTRALTEFERLHVGKTALRNGVLFYIVPRDRTFTVIGDESIHALCGQGFWDETAAAMEKSFREGKFTEGLVAGVQRAGDIMARHFPRKKDDLNELPDELVRD